MSEPKSRKSKRETNTARGGPAGLASYLSADGINIVRFRNDVVCKNIWTVDKF